jgi:hypothetical protein
MTSQEQSPPVDLLDHLQRQYLKGLDESLESDENVTEMDEAARSIARAGVQGFVDFCRERLNEDRPVTVTMIEDGIALRLQSGIELPVAQVVSSTSVQGEVAVTTPTVDKYHEYGGQQMQNTSPPIEITDGQNLGKGLPGKKQA